MSPEVLNHSERAVDIGGPGIRTHHQLNHQHIKHYRVGNGINSTAVVDLKKGYRFFILHKIRLSS